MGRCDSGWEPRIAEQDYQSFLGFCVFVSLSLSLCSLVCERLGGGLSMMSSLCAVVLTKNNFRKTNLLGMLASGFGPRLEGGCREAILIKSQPQKYKKQPQSMNDKNQPARNASKWVWASVGGRGTRPQSPSSASATKTTRAN